MRRLYGQTPAGRAVMDIRYRDLDPCLFGLGMQRGALFALLAQAWDGDAALQRDTQIVAIDDGLRRVQDQRGHWHGPFDLVIASDGAASALRAQVQGTRLDRAYPWGALWCLLPRGDWPFADELRQRYVAARKMIGLLPAGRLPGSRGHMLRVLTGMQRGWFGKLMLEPEFLQALSEAAASLPSIAMLPDTMPVEPMR